MGTEEEQKAETQRKELRRKNFQRTVMKHSCAAITLLGSFLYFSYTYAPFSTPSATKTTLLNRLVFALRWQLPCAASILIFIIITGNTRFLTSAINPLDLQDQGPVNVLGRILDNSEQQFLIHFVAIITMATIVEASSLQLIPAFSILFVIGRTAFTIGYLIHPMQRAFGMSINIWSVNSITVFCMYHLIKDGFDQDLSG